jgi:hypothetical protein
MQKRISFIFHVYRAGCCFCSEFNYDILPGPDHTKEVETSPSMLAQDSMRPCDHNSEKGKEVSTDPSESITEPETVIIGSVTKETLLHQAGIFF